MAVAFVTKNANGETGTNPIPVNNPGGISVGNLLIAHLSSDNSGYQTWSPPAGFDSFYSGYSSPLAVQTFWKVATQTDVNAYDFQFNGSLGGSHSTVTLMVFSGAKEEAPTIASAFVSANNTVTTAGLTPSANSMLVIMGTAQDLGSGTLTQASYAITTSDPSWTERNDYFLAANDMGHAFATATRPENTATGISTVVATPDGVTVDIYHQLFMAIASAEPIAYSLDVSVGAFTMTVNAATFRVFLPDITGLESRPSSSMTNDTKSSSTLTNTSKPSTSLTNESKP